LGKVHSQVLQTTVRRLHDTWEAFQKRGQGFPRFKKFGQFKSFVFPQFKDNPIDGYAIQLPKIEEVPINLHRPIPDGFKVKQVRVLSKVRGTQWYNGTLLSRLNRVYRFSMLRFRVVRLELTLD